MKTITINVGETYKISQAEGEGSRSFTITKLLKIDGVRRVIGYYAGNQPTDSISFTGSTFKDMMVNADEESYTENLDSMVI